MKSRGERSAKRSGSIGNNQSDIQIYIIFFNSKWKKYQSDALYTLSKPSATFVREVFDYLIKNSV